MIATCPKCDRTWETHSTAEMICCPSCQRKFPRPAPVVLPLGDTEPCDLCGHQGLEYHVCRIDGDAAIVCDACLRKLS